MRRIDVALRNLRRRKGRAALLVLGLALGTGTVVALMAITATMQHDIGLKLDQYGANILVVPRSSNLALSYGGLTVAATAYDVSELSNADVERIWAIKNAASLNAVAPKLLGAARLREQTVLLAGVLFDQELKLKPWWTVEQGRMPAAPGEALAGSRLAEATGLSVGSSAEVLGETVRVVGILADNGSQDDDILFVDLAVAQRLLERPRAVSLVEVAALCNACPIEQIVEEIGQAVPQAQVTALRQAVTLRMETVRQLERFALAVSLVVVVIGGLVVLTTMLGAITERRQEIGLFRALGFRRQHVFQVVLSEVALISLVGGFLGWLLGMAAATGLTPRIAGVTAPVSWDPVLALVGIGGALVLGLGAGLYPALQATRLDPTIALRSL